MRAFPSTTFHVLVRLCMKLFMEDNKEFNAASEGRNLPRGYRIHLFDSCGNIRVIQMEIFRYEFKIRKIAI